MERRLWPSMMALSGDFQNPASSGPRWRSASLMDTSSSSPSIGSFPQMPTIPHMTMSCPFARLRACVPCQLPFNMSQLREQPTHQHILRCTTAGAFSLIPTRTTPSIHTDLYEHAQQPQADPTRGERNTKNRLSAVVSRALHQTDLDFLRTTGFVR